jgi:hypothetical protein
MFFRLTPLATALLSGSLMAPPAAFAFEINAGDTTANVYGFAKLDIIQDLDADLGNAVNPARIRPDGQSGPEGHSTLHAYQSRFGIATTTPTPSGELTTRIEGDFFGSGGGEFRLRHAYGEWNGLLGGQTKTNFGSDRFIGFTPTVDFNGQVGQAQLGRLAQLRYNRGGFAAALEDPSGFIGASTLPLDEANTSKSRLPHLTLRYHGGKDAFQYVTSAMLREIEFYRGADDSSDRTLGWGLALETSLALGETVKVQGAVVHGDGIGNYLYGNPALASGVGAGYLDGNGQAQAITATGGVLGLSARVGPGSLNLAYGIATADLDDALADGAIHPAAGADDRWENLFVNYIWSPVHNVSYGIEAGYHQRGTARGESGDAVRLQGMVMYRF